MDSETTTKLKAIETWLTGEFAGIRSGQASPAILDSIKIESYGALLPIQQVGSVSIEDARTLRIAPWDTTQVKAIETAISEANLGVSVATDSSGLRVIFPELTSERRDQLLKLAKQRLEDARIRVRHVRDDEMKSLDRAEKDGDISEDEKFTEKDKVQKVVDSTNTALEALFAKKETELQS
ncbi:ribosome recycling factor [Candidatus Kaiserbacteria bacterium]|nr:ribosome recycling factor [Candidatus Kaiserbacteria bacterium]